MNNDELRTLRYDLLKEPIRVSIRPKVIQYIMELSHRATLLSKDDLTGATGHAITMDICGVLSYQTADGVDHDNWLNAKDELTLSKILQVSGELDFDSNNLDEWQTLFDLVVALKNE